jgi:hypothetical protein
MSRSDRRELELVVQRLHRAHPDWTGPAIEAELATLAAVAYGNWKDDTPLPRSRARQIQRWRRGESSGRRVVDKPQFTELWPLGENQRHAFESSFPPAPSHRGASHRLFLRNCSPRALRELHIRLGALEIGYEPELPAGGFCEVVWTRDPAVRSALLAAGDHEQLPWELRVEFATAEGARRGRLRGTLLLDGTSGWRSFRTADGTERSIE